MKYTKIKAAFYLLFVSVLLIVVTSCRKELGDNSLAETVWIHKLQTPDPIEKEAHAKALAFGKKTIECYFLDNNGKAIRLFETYKYVKKGYTILIDNESHEIMGEHYFLFKDQMYYISARKVTNLFE